MEKKEFNEEYYDLQTNIIPTIEPITEKYFKKEFIRKNLKKYEIINIPQISGRMEQRKGEKKLKIMLGFNEENFSGGLITGYGVYTIMHELIHLYHFSQWPIEKEKFDKYLKEAHCDLSAYEILMTSNDSRLEEAKEYSQKYNEILLNNKYDLRFEHYLDESRRLVYPHLNLEWCLAYQYLYSEKILKKRELILRNNKNYKE